MKFIRENPDLVKAAVANKNDHADVDKILELDSKRRMLLITGPNMGGKTALLKTLGLAVLMARSSHRFGAELPRVGHDATIDKERPLPWA